MWIEDEERQEADKTIQAIRALSQEDLVALALVLLPDEELLLVDDASLRLDFRVAKGRFELAIHEAHINPSGEAEVRCDALGDQLWIVMERVLDSGSCDFEIIGECDVSDERIEGCVVDEESLSFAGRFPLNPKSRGGRRRARLVERIQETEDDHQRRALLRRLDRMDRKLRATLWFLACTSHLNSDWR